MGLASPRVSSHYLESSPRSDARSHRDKTSLAVTPTIIFEPRFLEKAIRIRSRIMGRSLTLNEESYTVIGVLPPGRPWLDAAEVFTPMVRNPDARTYSVAHRRSAFALR